MTATSSSDGTTLTQARLDVLDGYNGSSDKTDNPTGNSTSPSSVDNRDEEKPPSKIKHVFMVRLLEMHAVLTEDEEKATRVVCVLIDNFTVVDGHYVDEVLSRVSVWNISSELKVEYYPGKLYKKVSTMKMHLPLIIGASVGEW